MNKTTECPNKDCGNVTEVKISTGNNKPENAGKAYISCPKCGKFSWVPEFDDKNMVPVNSTQPALIRETVKNPDWDAIAEGKVRHGVAVAFIQALGPRLIEEGVPIISDTIRLEMDNWVEWIMKGTK